MKIASETLHHKMTLLAWAIIAGFLITSHANATEKLTIVVDQVRVFTSPSMSSPVITILKKGQVVPAGVNPGGGFKKVLVQDATGKKIIGYVALVDLTPPIFGNGAKDDNSKKKGKKGKATKGNNLGLRRHYALGVNIGFNYQFQGSKTLSDSAGDSATVTGLSGTNVVLGILFDIPLSPTFSLELDANYKPSSLTGTGTDVGIGATLPSTIVDQQVFYALGVTGKIYSGVNSDWWYGPGLEYDHGNSGSLQFGANPTYTFTSSDLANYIMVYAATGYDFSSSKNFYITPSFRFGAVVNGNPPIYEFDMIISGSYRF